MQIFRTGTLVAGKYRIIEEIGQGGMGIVYKAEDIKLKRCVALKFLPPHLMSSPELRERFLIEAQAAAALPIRTSASSTRSGKAASILISPWSS